MDISIVIPAYNEQDLLARTVDEAVEALRARGLSGEIIVVNDGSSDDTRGIADALVAEGRAARALHHPSNRGFGAALRTGLAAATGTWVTYLPGDGQLAPAEMLALYDQAGGADLVVGLRRHHAQWTRRLITYGFLLCLRLVLGIEVQANICYFVIRGDVLKTLHLHMDSGIVNVEVLVRCRDQGRKIIYDLVEGRIRDSGHSKMANIATIMKTFREMLALR